MLNYYKIFFKTIYILFLLYWQNAYAMENSVQEVRVDSYDNIKYDDISFTDLAKYNNDLSKEIYGRTSDKNIASVRIYVVYHNNQQQNPNIEYRDFTYNLGENQQFSYQNKQNHDYKSFKEAADINLKKKNKTLMDNFDPTAIFYQSGWEHIKDSECWHDNINGKQMFIDRYITFQHIYGNNENLFKEALKLRGITGEIKPVKYYHSEQLFISHVLSGKDKGFNELSSDNVVCVLINIVSKNPCCESCFNSLKNISTDNNFKCKFLSQLFKDNVNNILKNIPVSILYTAVTDYPSIQGTRLWRYNERLQAVNNIQTALNLKDRPYFIQMGAFKEGGSTENGLLPYANDSIYFSYSQNQNKFVKGIPSKKDKHPGYRTQVEIVEPEQFDQIAKIQKTQQSPKNDEFKQIEKKEEQEEKEEEVKAQNQLPASNSQELEQVFELIDKNKKQELKAQQLEKISKESDPNQQQKKK